MAGTTPTLRSRGRMPSLDTVFSTCSQADDSGRRYSLSRRHAYSEPELEEHLNIPLGKKKSGDGGYFRSPLSRLLRRRSTNLSSLPSYSKENSNKPIALKSLMERIFTDGERSPSKVTTESGRRLTFADVAHSQTTYQRVLEKRKAKMLQLRKTASKKLLFRKFRRIARLTVFCIRACSTHCLTNSDEDELSPFLKPLHFRDYPNMAGVELMFDPSRFKASKQTRISDEIKRILSKSPKERTEQDLYTAQIAMRNIKCFQEYPARMQRLIAEVGIYESFESRRVLVRQGHPASSFYFILSGTVVVMVMDLESQYARPVAYLCKGQTFGELAIINRTCRQSTVIAKELSEFLTISVDDYHRIFMAGGVKCITDPDHDHFLKHLSFMDGWPLHHLEEQPSKCLFLYFKRGDVLVKDSHYSDWLIVVKSGSISVLKKLRKVEAYEWRSKRGSLFAAEKERRVREQKRQQWRTSILPELHVQLRQSVDDETEYHEDGTLCMFRHPQHSQSDDDMLHSQFFDTQVWQFGKPRDSNRGEFSIIHLPDLTRSERCRLRPGSLGTDLEANLTARSQRMRNRDVTVRPHSLNNAVLSSATLSRGQQTTDHVAQKRRASIAEREREMMGFPQHVRTIGEDLDAGIKRKDPDDLTLADLNPEFVNVQNLTKGQVFGVVDLFLGQQTSFCVVSNGADCLLINKHLYMDHVNEDLFRKMRQELCPYPSEEVLQTSLQTSVDWSAYREVTLADTVKLVKQRKAVT